jgi:hypothetical protein
MTGLAGFLTLTAWWLETWRGERLRPALIFLNELKLGAHNLGIGNFGQLLAP